MPTLTLDILVKAYLIEILTSSVNDKQVFLQEKGEEILHLLDLFLKLDDSFEAKLSRGLKALELAGRIGFGSHFKMRQSIMDKRPHELPLAIISLLLERESGLALRLEKDEEFVDSGEDPLQVGDFLYGNGIDLNLKSVPKNQEDVFVRSLDQNQFKQA